MNTLLRFKRSYHGFLLLFLLLGTIGTSKVYAIDTPDFTPNDPDFAVQGEYAGEITKVDGKQKLGVQVAAQGDGKFFVVSYAGGLPGEGWNKSPAQKANGKTVDGVTTFQVGEDTMTIKGSTLVIANKAGMTIGELQKVARKSPTLGAKPPSGATVLFDGPNVNQFEGQVTDDGLLKEGATSKQKLQSGTLHIEFRVPFNLKDIQRGNSGCYLQGRYEVQIMNSFGLPPHNHECGGIPTVKEPEVNMCYPPYAWQTYDVDFTAATYKDGKKDRNARMTVRQNGVLIQQDVEIPQTTTSAPVADETSAPGPIYLQDHSSPVRFRNIWFVPKS